MIEQITLKNANISDKSLHLSVQKTYSHKQGNNDSLDRSEVTGSGKKLFKQKGTGNARAGNKKTTQRRGGGKAFGPKFHLVSFKVNKKVKRLARKSALSIKAKQKSIFVLEDFEFDTPKTQVFIKMLTSLGLADKKSVLVLGELNKNVYLSSRNLKNSKVVINSELNTYGISNANSLIISESAVAKIESLLNN